jgi:hypothetical protein
MAPNGFQDLLPMASRMASSMASNGFHYGFSTASRMASNGLQWRMALDAILEAIGCQPINYSK